MVTRGHVLAFGQALLLSVCLYMGLFPILMSFDSALGELPGFPTGLFIVFWPIASIVAGLVFLRRRVQTQRWIVLDVLFVVACLGAAVVLFLVMVRITGDGP